MADGLVIYAKARAFKARAGQSQWAKAKEDQGLTSLPLAGTGIYSTVNRGTSVRSTCLELLRNSERTGH